MRARSVLHGVIISLALSMAGPAVSFATAQEAIYIVRHAERLDDSSDSPLSVEGQARAARLADMLRDAGISTIFVTEYQRNRDTAQPLATKLGLSLQVVVSADTPGLLAKVRALGPKARVLIVGHGDTIPNMLAALGYPPPVTIAKAEYDNFFLVMPGNAPGAGPVVIRLRY